MRTAPLVAALVLVAGLAFAAAPAAKPARSGKPSATPAATPKTPEKDECTGLTKDGSAFAATQRDYQACLREITNAVKAKLCVDGVRAVDFVFHRGGQKPTGQTAVCN